MNGGSIRLFIAHAGHGARPPPRPPTVSRSCGCREFEMALDSPAPYEQFARNVERVRDELERAVRSR